MKTVFAVFMIAALVTALPLSAIQSKSLAGTWKVIWTDGNHNPQEIPPLYTLPIKDPGRPTPRILKTGNEVALRKGK